MIGFDLEEEQVSFSKQWLYARNTPLMFLKGEPFTVVRYLLYIRYSSE